MRTDFSLLKSYPVLIVCFVCLPCRLTSNLDAFVHISHLRQLAYIILSVIQSALAFLSFLHTLSFPVIFFCPVIYLKWNFFVVLVSAL